MGCGSSRLLFSDSCLALARELQLKVPEDLEQLHLVFQDTDADNSGGIDVGEFYAFVKVKESIFVNSLFRLLGSLDLDCQLIFGDWMKVVCIFCALNDAEILRFSFDTFDMNKSNYIERNEMRMMLKFFGGASKIFQKGLTIDQFLEDFDADGDGRIDFSEFAEVNDRYPELLQSVFTLQEEMRKNTLGVAFWIHHRCKLSSSADRRIGEQITGWTDNPLVSLSVDPGHKRGTSLPLLLESFKSSAVESDDHDNAKSDAKPRAREDSFNLEMLEPQNAGAPASAPVSMSAPVSRSSPANGRRRVSVLERNYSVLSLLSKHSGGQYKLDPSLSRCNSAAGSRRGSNGSSLDTTQSAPSTARYPTSSPSSSTRKAKKMPIHSASAPILRATQRDPCVAFATSPRSKSKSKSKSKRDKRVATAPPHKLGEVERIHLPPD